MEVIHAKVNERLLSKADRLFTGTLDGRIIEILQNARRAGATEVRIVNSDGWVTVHDNGPGIEDFGALLDLGRSDWDAGLEDVEDPAGVGVFCLAPRELRITSRNRKVVIVGNGWTGRPVTIRAAEAFIEGTQLTFEDSPWLFEVVEKFAVFTGLRVTVDGRKCACGSFVSNRAVSYPVLGCRIEVRQEGDQSQFHDRWKQRCYSENMLVNFHGQIVSSTYRPIGERLVFLVDLTGEPTGIRLMLPARTCLVENEAFAQLQAAIEREAYEYIRRRGSHKLKFGEYCRAQALGIDLPEAESVFQVGLLVDDPVEPVEVVKPTDLPLDKCYRLSKTLLEADECNEANTHLLSALGTFDSPFVVVDISGDYDGYSWTKLPTVDHVQLKVGKELHEEPLWCEMLVAVEDLEITALASDGKTFTSRVPMAVRLHESKANVNRWVGTDVLVTVEARERLTPTDIWYHLGGWSDEGDTYDTQLADFEEQLNLFWADVIGPGEYLRQRLLDCLRDFRINWERIEIHSSGTVWISYKDGRAEMLQPPKFSAQS